MKDKKLNNDKDIFIKKVNEGLMQVKEGKTIKHEEILTILRKRYLSKSDQSKS